MRSDLDSLLCTRFPNLFAQRNLNPQQTGMCWGFMCGEGWYPLIFGFCEEVERLIQHDGLPAVEITQVKSKMGSLRIHYSGGDERVRVMVDLLRTVSEHIDEKGASLSSR